MNYSNNYQIGSCLTRLLNESNIIFEFDSRSSILRTRTNRTRARLQIVRVVKSSTCDHIS